MFVWSNLWKFSSSKLGHFKVNKFNTQKIFHSYRVPPKLVKLNVITYPRDLHTHTHATLACIHAYTWQTCAHNMQSCDHLSKLLLLQLVRVVHRLPLLQFHVAGRMLRVHNVHVHQHVCFVRQDGWSSEDNTFAFIHAFGTYMYYSLFILFTFILIIKLWWD